MDIELERKIESLERQRDNALRMHCPMFDRRFPRSTSWRISGVNQCVAKFLFDNKKLIF